MLFVTLCVLSRLKASGSIYPTHQDGGHPGGLRYLKQAEGPGVERS